MVGILEILWGILQYWHTIEFRRLRNSIVAGVVMPLASLLFASIVGAWSWSAKLIFIEIELFGAAICLIWLAYRRTPLAMEIATAIRVARDPALRNPVDAAYDYLRLVAAVIASELAVGLLVLWLPVHRNYPMSFLALATVMIFITYTIWRKGAFWWPKLVYRLAIFTLIAALFSIILPQTSVIIGRLGGGIDEKIAGKLECIENSNLPQCKPTPAPAVAPVPTAIAPPEVFVLEVGKVIQTVEIRPGTHHQLQSNKKFIAVSIQPDGSERKYEMPVGTSYWNGAAPWGRLLLEAIEDGTRVKIAPIN